MLKFIIDLFLYMFLMLIANISLFSCAILLYVLDGIFTFDVALHSSMCPRSIFLASKLLAHSLASIKKAKDILGYEPLVHFEEGLKKTVDWYWPNTRP